MTFNNSFDASSIVYKGNTGVKKDGVPQAYSQEELQEYAKCANDASYFCKTYLKIIHIDRGLVPFELYPYQEEMFKHFNDNKFSIVLACRQSGKSAASVGYLLWYALFKGDKNIAIIANKGSTARTILGRALLMLENVPFFLQPGTKVLNRGSVEFSNNSRIFASSTSSDSIRGESCVAGNTKICVIDDDSIYYTEINKIINNSKFIQVKENEMIYTVYEITNKINDKIYVGYHQTLDVDDGYMGSGILIQRAIEKYGIENFNKKILKRFDNKKDAELYEAKIVDKDFTLREDTYNIALGGNVRIMYGKTHSEKWKLKNSEIKTGNTFTLAHIVIINNIEYRGIELAAEQLNIQHNIRNSVLEMCGNDAFQHVYFKDDQKQRAAIKFYIRQCSIRTNYSKIKAENARKRFTGVSLSAEHKQKISNALVGIPRENKHNKDPEKIKKMADTHRGMKRSDESKKKMSIAKLGKPAKNKGKKYYRNVITNEGNYFLPAEAPKDWVQVTGVRK